MANDLKVKDSAFPTYTPPGISFTAPEKSRPWQQPPKIVDLGDVVNYYISAISDAEIVDDLLNSLETGVSLASIAESMMLVAVSQGIHTIDAGILAMPVIIEMLITAAEINDIDYIVYEDDLKLNKVPARAAKEAVKRAIDMMKSGEKNIEEPEAEMPMGLMARNKVEV